MNIDAVRNQAITVWIRNYPVDERLEAFLQTVDPVARAPVVKSSREALNLAESLLEEWAERGPVNPEQFGVALGDALRERFDWINEPAISALRAHSHWYAWHEGY